MVATLQHRVVLHRRSGRSLSGVLLVIALHVLVVIAFISGTRIVYHSPVAPPEVRFIEPNIPPPQRPEVETKPKMAQVVPSDVTPPVLPPIDPVVPDITPPPTRDATPSNLPAGPVVTGGEGVAKPSTVLGVACPNARRVHDAIVYPIQAQREGLQGDVVARFVVGASGEIRNVQIMSSSNRVFNNAVTQAVRQFNCVGQGQDVTVEAPFSFRLN